MRIDELIVLQKRCHGPRRVRANLGDGYLYQENPYFRRVRDAALKRGFRFTTEDPGHYFGFPLAALEDVLETRRIPLRDNYSALVALESRRPGFFTLKDLDANRPTPNYLLHEAAHGVAYHELFGRTREARAVLSSRRNLVKVMSGEAFAMTAEYLAACCVANPIHRWLFSINSYRHRVQMKKPLGQSIEALGLRAVTAALFAGFLRTNFLHRGMTLNTVVDAIERFSGENASGIAARDLQRLRRAVVGATRMNPEFLTDTTRLFLTRLGYSRNVAQVLALDPLEAAEADSGYDARVRKLLAILDP